MEMGEIYGGRGDMIFCKAGWTEGRLQRYVQTPSGGIQMVGGVVAANFEVLCCGRLCTAVSWGLWLWCRSSPPPVAPLSGPTNQLPHLFLPRRLRFGGG
ncbi:hypothetical protein CRG98_032942 [Punica granatum]|uniref:Uncharacterized protein n=1 Tax=Punica granatum TaxID=22663 RepID=A0A2I0ISG4_PUNGR|nr:hypothetical protein CRG98_032942 [Punica granatum]